MTTKARKEKKKEKNARKPSKAAAADGKAFGQALSNALKGPPRVPMKAYVGAQPPPTDLVKRVCSLTDPFCPASSGSRLVDDFVVATDTSQIRKIVPVATSVGDAFFFTLYVSADGYQYSVNTNSSLGGSAALAAPNVQVNAAWTTILTTNAKKARVVSAGVRFWNSLAATVAGGFIETAEHAPHIQDGITITPGALNQLFPNTVTLDLRSPMTWIARPATKMWAEFVIPSSAASPAASDANTRWTNFTAVFTGPASTALGYLEIVFNLEYEPLALAANIALTTPVRQEPKQSDGLVQKAMVAVQGKLPAVFNKTAEVVGGIVERMAMTALSGAANYFLPGSGYGVQALGAGMRRMAIKNVD